MKKRKKKFCVKNLDGYCPLSMGLGAGLGVAAGWARARLGVLGVQAGAGGAGMARKAQRPGRGSSLGRWAARRAVGVRERASARADAQVAGAQGRAKHRRAGDSARGTALAGARGARQGERARGWAHGARGARPAGSMGFQPVRAGWASWSRLGFCAL